MHSAGKKFREALKAESPLQIVGTINAYCALLAERAGFRAIYLSGAGVANASLGVPDLGITMLNDVLEDVRRITGASNLPLLIDADTGWGGPLNIARTVREATRAGAAGLHLEDQIFNKRCGHREGKVLVSSLEMQERIKAAVDAKIDREFVIMARTDALASEGINAMIDRANDYVAVGAEMIFAEAVKSLDEYKQIVANVNVPILANITEFGKTPLFTRDELGSVGIKMILYPLSAFRAMNAAANAVYKTIRTTGTQQSVIDLMQTRTELYDYLNYESYEKKLDELLENI